MLWLVLLPFRLLFAIVFGIVALPFVILLLPFALLLWLPIVLLKVTFRLVLGLLLIPLCLLAGCSASCCSGLPRSPRWCRSCRSRSSFSCCGW